MRDRRWISRNNVEIHWPDGIDPPENNLVDYSIADQIVEYPPCRKCGAAHGMGIKEMATGKIEPLDLCYNCFWKIEVGLEPT